MWLFETVAFIIRIIWILLNIDSDIFNSIVAGQFLKIDFQLNLGRCIAYLLTCKQFQRFRVLGIAIEDSV